MSKSGMRMAALVLTAAFSGTTEAALMSRLNGQAVYDTTNNITWIADTRLAATETFGLPVGTLFNVTQFEAQYSFGRSGFISSTGDMNWSATTSWVAAMNSANYLGFGDWRTPEIVPFCDTCDSEFYQLNSELAAIGHDSSGLFLSVNFGGGYWSSTIYPWDAYPGYYAYYYAFGNNAVRQVDNTTRLFGTMVFRYGDVAAVPEPETYAMMLAGLLFIGLAKRHQARTHSA